MDNNYYYQIRFSTNRYLTKEGNVYYHFLPKPEDGHICKRLFNIDKPFGVIQPDETIVISIEAFVDPETAHV